MVSTPSNHIVKQFENSSLEELRMAAKLINELIQERLDDKRYTVRNQLLPNQRVTVNHPKVAGREFTVVKVNRKNAKLRCIDSGVQYNVSLTLIQPK